MVTCACLMSATYASFVDNLTSAINNGWRHIDAAEVYSTNAEIGVALSSFTSTGKIPRSEFFITTKVHPLIGMKKDSIIQKFLTQMPARFETPEEGPGRLNGCYLELNDQTGKAVKIKPIRIDTDHPQELPPRSEVGSGSICHS